MDTLVIYRGHEVALGCFHRHHLIWEQQPNQYGEGDKVYAKDEGEGKTPVFIDKILGDRMYKV